MRKTLPLVEVVIPCYNEAGRDLPKNIPILVRFLSSQKKFRWHVTIADNASTDRTPQVGRTLAKKYKNVSYLRIPVKGRGLALRTAWSKSKADVLSYMDADLSTDLIHFTQLVQAVLGGADIATGTRLAKGAKVERRAGREILSRGYKFIVKRMLHTKISDLQCGFKAISRSATRKLLPKVKDNEFFFDTELLVRAERAGMKVAEIPVHWVEDKNSRVRVGETVKKYLRDVARLRKELQ